MGRIKTVVSVSIGSSKRDHEVELDLFGEHFHIRREGTDGDFRRAGARLRELDGTVDAFGLGGVDLSLTAAGRTYRFREGMRLGRACKATPIVDGSGLKGAVEADLVRYMADDLGLELKGKRVMVCSAVDRWGLTEGFYAAGCRVTAADLLYALGVDVMLRDRKHLERVIHVVAPLATQLPFKVLYPAEADHETAVDHASKHAELYRQADIIAGDYKYVRQWMPEDMAGKWVVTNTTTGEDVRFLRDRGVELLVTSTPRLRGRTFGTNVVEATLIALEGAHRPLIAGRYLQLLKAVGFKPDVLWLQTELADE